MPNQQCNYWLGGRKGISAVTRSTTNLFKLQSADILQRLFILVQVFKLRLEIRVMLVVRIREEHGVFIVAR